MLTWVESIYRTIVDFFEGLTLTIKHSWAEITRFINEPHVMLNWLWTWAQDLTFYIANNIISWISQLCVMVVSVFPTFGLQDINVENYLPSRYLSAFNWVIPFDTLSQAVALLVVSTTLWATLGVFMRWLKVNI